MKCRICLLLAVAFLCACKKQQTTDLKSTTTSGKPPIVIRPSGDGSEIGYGFHFKSTISTDKYEITSADCGHALRFNRDGAIAVNLPLLPFPCALMLTSIKAGPVNVTITQQMPDGSGGDFNGERNFSLGLHHGAIMHVNQNSAFYRGVYTCRAGFCGSGGGDIAPIAPTGASSYGDLSDFQATVTSDTVLTIAPGAAAINHHSFAAPMGGTVEFTGGTGDAKVYCSKLGILTTETVVGSTAKSTGQMVMLTAAIPSFPPGSIPICDLTLNAGKYSVDGVDGCRLASRVRAAAFDAGSGIDIKYTAGVGTLAVDATVARVDGTNVWTGSNDFTNANVVMPGGGASAQAASKTLSLTALVVALIALAIVLWRWHQESAGD